MVFALSAPTAIWAQAAAEDSKNDHKIDHKIDSWAPFIPLVVDPLASPYYFPALRDPAAVASEGRQDLEDLEDACASFEKKYKSAKPNEKNGVAKQWLDSSIKFANAVLGQPVVGFRAPGSYDEQSVNQAANGRRKKAALYLRTSARLNVKKNKDAKEAARLKYYEGLAELMVGRWGATADLMRPVVGALAPDLMLRAQFILAMNDLSFGDARSRSKVLDSLRELAGRVPAPAAVAAHLTISRIQAGINSSGVKVDPAVKGWESELAQIADLSQGLHPKEREYVTSAIFAVWRAAVGDKGSWMQPPVDPNRLGNPRAGLAIAERQTLENARSGKTDEAIASFETLAKEPSLADIAAKMDIRAMQLGELRYLQKSDAPGFEALVVRIIARNKRDSSDVKNLQLIARRMYFGLVNAEFAKARQKDSQESLRLSSIDLGQRYLAFYKDGPEFERLMITVAEVQAYAGKDRDAVDTYLLTRKRFSSSPKVFAYLTAAAALQYKISLWPPKAPWMAMPPKTNEPDRERLLSILVDSDGVSVKAGTPRDEAGWARTAQIGLIQLSLGKAEETWKLWVKEVRSTPVGPDALQAAGWTLDAFLEASRWDELESLSRFTLSNELAAVHGPKAVDSREMLRIALFRGGKQALEKKDFTKASAKLEEYVQVFANAADRDEAFQMLARSRAGERLFIKSVSAWASLAKEYPQSKFIKEALLSGGDLSADIAMDNEATWFYARYVAGFLNSPETLRVRDALLALYVGHGRFPEAESLLSRLSTDKNLPEPVRLAAAVKLMSVEELYGDRPKAAVFARQLLAMPGVDRGNQALAYSVWARSLNKDKDQAQLASIEASLVKLGGDGVSVQEALGEIRFLWAESKSNSLMPDVVRPDDLNLKGTLDIRRNAFRAITASYQRVCEAGDRGWCAPALLRLSVLAAQANEETSTIEVPPRATDMEEKKLKTGIEQWKKELAGLERESRSKSRALLDAGLCVPDWIAGVKEGVGKDWQLESFDSRIADGFVQWIVAGK